MTFTAGEKLRAPDLRESFAHTSVLLADTALSNSQALTDAPGLTVLTEPTTRYVLNGYLAYSTGTTPDLTIALIAPIAAFGTWGVAALDTGGGMVGQRVLGFNDTLTISISGSGSQLAAHLSGFLHTIVGGPLQLRFAQTTADVSATRLLAGSWLSLAPADT